MTKPVKRLFVIGVAALLMAAAVSASAGGAVARDMPTAAYGNVDIPVGEDFYSYCMKKAVTQDQKDALERLKHDHSVGWGYYKREALTIIGGLPKDQRRLTLADAIRILNEANDEAAIIAKCNEIAGAPDFVGGSGITHTVYFLNDERTEAVHISLSIMVYQVFDKEGKPIRTEPLNGTFTPATTKPVVRQPASTCIFFLNFL